MPPGSGGADLRRTPGRCRPVSRRPPPTASSPSPAGPPDRGPPPNSEGHVIMALPPYPASDFPDTPTAIVTGGASERGIGRATAHRLARDRKSTRLNSSHVAISY